jgi:hypothetical protein
VGVHAVGYMMKDDEGYMMRVSLQCSPPRTFELYKALESQLMAYYSFSCEECSLYLLQIQNHQLGFLVYCHEVGAASLSE